MNEAMLYDILVFLGVMGSVITGGVVLSRYLKYRRLPSAAADPVLLERIAQLEEAVASTTADVDRLAEAQDFLTRMIGDSGRGAIPGPQPDGRVRTPR